MSDERWQRIKDVLQAALERAPELRSAFLDEACGDDAEMRTEVEQLLVSHGEAGSFLEEPAALPGPLPLVGKRVGSYRILGEIGRGGMGRVYRAVRDDDSFQREVAVKVAGGGFDWELGAARFLRERQILARLHHPNIATLHDGGATEEGQPYLVMELVDGEPLDAYCASRQLGVRERLALFLTVCDAVHYAHQNLVVHRDLKPSNILVTSEGAPKLLDFGISKLLSPEGDLETLPTATILPLLTPEYASPEQVRGEPVTTASDVYSLGVVLYELLAGARPYDITTRSPEEVLRVVCGADPERPSTAVRRRTSRVAAGPATQVPASALQGDLDTIVLKCLRKDASRRYGSARELSEDLGNFLEGRPVQARPDSAAYRASKFVRRHRAAVVATALALLALVGTTLVALVQAREARLARTRAEKRFQDVRRLAHSVIFELHDGIQRLPGSTSVRELLVKRALEYLDELDRDSPGDPGLKAELAAAYEKIGDVQGGIASQNLGHRADAKVSYRRALALRQELASRYPGDPDHQRGLSAMYGRLGMLASWDSDLAGAAANYSLQLEAMRNVIRMSPGDVKSRRSAAAALANLGQVRAMSGDVEQGLADSREAIRLFESLVREDPPELRKAGFDVDDTLASVRQMLGENLVATGRPAEAVTAFGPSLAYREAQVRKAPDDTVAKAKLAFLLVLVGEAQQRAGALVESSRSFARSVLLCEGLLAADPTDEATHLTWLYAQISWGELDVKAGRPKDAESRLRSALERLRPRLAPSSPSTEDKRLVRFEASAEHALALAVEARRAEGRGEGEACAHHLRAQEAWRAALGDGSLDRSDAEAAAQIRAAADRCRASAGVAGPH
jgi:eukaryotic-like serine/threonine-protein kinase